ncbi:MAG: helix-turn-helix domain-containing protein [Micromonosporaceae bacterium]
MWTASRSPTGTWSLVRDLLPSGQGRPSHLPYAGRVPRGATQRAHRKLAYDACELLGTGEFTLGLTEMATIIGSSASHLSRVFAGVTGRSVTSYRNHLRIQVVVRDIAEGARSLRTLAASYGFADQAHLTRVMRAYTGHSPSSVRRLLHSVSVHGRTAK